MPGQQGKHFSAEVARFENEVELGEGLATFIEIHSAGISSGLWRSKLEMLGRLNREGWGADRLRFYYSGMAWELLSEKYAPSWQGSGWRSMVCVVAEALGQTPDPDRHPYPEIDFREILARYDTEVRLR